MDYDNKMEKFFGLLSNEINSNDFNDISLNFFNNNRKKLNKKFPKTMDFIESSGLIDSISSSNVDKNKVLNDYFEAKNIFDSENISNYDDNKLPHSKITKLEINYHDYILPQNNYDIFREKIITLKSESIERLVVDGENDSIGYNTKDGGQTQNFSYHSEYGLEGLLDDLDDEVSKFDKKSKIVPDAFLRLKVSYADGKNEFYFYKDNGELPTNWKDFTRRIEYYFQNGNLSRNIFDIEPPEKEYLICKVKFNDYGTSYSYLINDEKLKVGDRVLVPVGANGNQKEVTVDSIGKYTDTTSSFPISKMKHVIAKVTKKYDYYNDDQPITDFVNYDEDSAIQVKVCDLTRIKCDALVYEEDTEYVNSSDINEVAGPKLKAEYKKFNDNDDLVITKGYNLPAENVIHYVDKQDGVSPYKQCLEMAKANELNSIVFPDVLFYESKNSLDTKAANAMEEISDWLDENEDYKLDVLIACDNQNSYDSYYDFFDDYEGDNDYIIETEFI
ncbi:macro domain-containing protein [Companilactobacillus nodensis]|uniref:Macro domain-containing protein n=1 Tax=Companilactobacillus nodensis DSM 19682 = JCM 14932 = NBRC 107160 TaxID=1423775 RepID=A0A0R1KHM2_9LACO|nr:macro domain-containing protein [Companilactobacillus nodensis]KRK79522.1 hypothetical protein FD03_GL000657 [Companilactobacillus nodensis DSM 19682 = JCM 14932 = NBRC 107160]